MTILSIVAVIAVIAILAGFVRLALVTVEAAFAIGFLGLFAIDVVFHGGALTMAVIFWLFGLFESLYNAISHSWGIS